MSTKARQSWAGPVRRAEAFLAGDAARRALEVYFSGRFSGAWFDAAGRDTDPATGVPVDPTPTRLTIEDILSLTLLDAGLGPDQMTHLLDLNIDIHHLLARIHPSLTLADAPDPEDESEGPWVAANEMFKLVRKVPHVGRSRASKLLARKRPHLIPIWDRHLAAGLGMGKRDNDWAIVQQIVRTHGERLAELRTDLETAHPDDGRVWGLSQLRLLDVVVWMRTHGARLCDPSLILDLGKHC
jgi:Family of unknown function (DUF6308)